MTTSKAPLAGSFRRRIRSAVGDSLSGSAIFFPCRRVTIYPPMAIPKRRAHTIKKIEVVKFIPVTSRNITDA
jgi:hypothetical protein